MILITMMNLLKVNLKILLLWQIGQMEKQVFEVMAQIRISVHFLRLNREMKIF